MGIGGTEDTRFVRRVGTCLYHSTTAAESGVRDRTAYSYYTICNEVLPTRNSCMGASYYHITGGGGSSEQTTRWSVGTLSEAGGGLAHSRKYICSKTHASHYLIAYVSNMCMCTTSAQHRRIAHAIDGTTSLRTKVTHCHKKQSLYNNSRKHHRDGTLQIK